jgi:SNF2 family DNA or RNA helicase
VVFITKLKAIASVESDYEQSGYNLTFDLIVFNYEKVPKYLTEIKQADFVILDEAHGLGQFPKPAMKTRELKQCLQGKPIIYLSGTPSPESYSQLYHQLWVSSHSPWTKYPNFYAWAKEYVTVKERRFSGVVVKDYSQANKERIFAETERLFHSFTQSDAGFEVSRVTETRVPVVMGAEVARMTRELKLARITSFQGIEIACDTASAFRSCVHQISSGTCIADVHIDGDVHRKGLILDTSKAKYIRDNYEGQKIAVFYQFVAERDMLELVLDNTTSDPKIFASDPESLYISQIQSGSQGVDLSVADVLIFLNVNFSAMHYLQSRARLQKMNRTKPAVVHYLCSVGGIEERILNMVQNKEDYTLSHFMRDYRD